MAFPKTGYLIKCLIKSFTRLDFRFWFKQFLAKQPEHSLLTAHFGLIGRETHQLTDRLAFYSTMKAQRADDRLRPLSFKNSCRLKTLHVSLKT